MRVSKVDTVNIYTLKALNNNSSYMPKNGISADFIAFQGSKAKEDKPSFIEKVRGLFKKDKEPLTPEEQKSEDIKYYLGDVEDLIKEFKKEGKAFQNSAKNILYIGKQNDYKGYIPLAGSKDKLVFSKVDKETGIPDTATIVDTTHGLTVAKTYEFIDGVNCYRVNDYSVEDTDIKMDFLGAKLLHYVETDRKTGLSKQLIPTSKGFSYFEGKLDYEGEPVETHIDIDFKYDENDRSAYYKERNSEGEFITYRYNTETDMWQVE